MMISYAQKGEDVVLDRIFGRQSRGFYVDVGANDPIFDSVTRHFYLSGWTGINVEPLPGPFARLVNLRPKDINLQVGVSDKRGALVLYEVPSNNGLSTFNAELAEKYRSEGEVLVERTVATLPLSEICEAHVRQLIDFMKIDVEGHEYEVISGMDWRRWRPRVLVIEAGWHAERWEPTLFAAGELRDNCNHFYVREEDREWLSLLRCPANMTDNYIRYDLQCELDKNREWESLGTVILSIARALNHFKRRHPRLVALAKSTVLRARLMPRDPRLAETLPGQLGPPGNDGPQRGVPGKPSMVNRPP